MKLQQLQEAGYANKSEHIDRIISAVHKAREINNETSVTLPISSSEAIRILQDSLGPEDWDSTDFGDKAFWVVEGIKIQVWGTTDPRLKQTEVYCYPSWS